MKTLLAILFCIFACLVAAPDADAGPLCRVLGAARAAASVPFKAVGRVRENRQEARQSRRAAKGC
jgi:hypothetical protein